MSFQVDKRLIPHPQANRQAGIKNEDDMPLLFTGVSQNAVNQAKAVQHTLKIRAQRIRFSMMEWIARH